MKSILYRLLQAYAFLIPLEYIYVVLLGFDHPLKPYRIVGIIILLLSVLFFIRRKQAKLDRYDISLIIIFSYGLGLALVYDAFGLGHIEYTYNNIQLLLFAMPIYILIKNMRLSYQQIHNIFRAFVAAILINAVFMVFHSSNIIDGVRLRGFYKNPGEAGFGISIAILYLIFLYFRNKTGARSKVLGVELMTMMVIGLLSYSLYLTGARGAVVGLVAAVFAFTYGLGRRLQRKTLKKLMFTLLIAVAVGATNFLPTVADDNLSRRYEIEELASNEERLDIWRSAFLVAEDHYFVGVGMTQYKAYHHEYIRKLDNVRSRTVLAYDLSAHSDYVAFYVENGLIMLFVYLFVVYGMASQAAKLTKKVDLPELHLFSVFIFSLIVNIVVQGAFRVSVSFPSYWLFMALCFAYFDSNRRMRRNEKIIA